MATFHSHPSTKQSCKCDENLIASVLPRDAISKDKVDQFPTSHMDKLNL